MNISVWLNQMEEYLDAKKLQSDKQKQQAVLERLDKTSRSTIQALINDLQRFIQSHHKLLFKQRRINSRLHRTIC